jgi:plasmid maintenance system antidote protein VapI
VDKVKRAVKAGVSIPVAIREALGMSISAFALKHRLPRSSATNHIRGHVKATPDTINALIAELGGTEEEWRHLLWQAAKPENIAV